MSTLRRMMTIALFSTGMMLIANSAPARGWDGPGAGGAQWDDFRDMYRSANPFLDAPRRYDRGYGPGYRSRGYEPGGPYGRRGFDRGRPGANAYGPGAYGPRGPREESGYGARRGPRAGEGYRQHRGRFPQHGYGAPQRHQQGPRYGGPRGGEPYGSGPPSSRRPPVSPQGR